jgi:capsular polysaccharide biosynthesis protein
MGTKLLKRVEKSDIELVITKNVFVIKWYVVRNLFSLNRASIFKNLPFKERARFNILSFLSFFRNPIKILKGGDYYFVCNFWSNGYYHWVTEVWKKLVLFNTELQNGTILISKHSPAYIKETLKLFGINNIYEYKGNCFVTKLNIISNSVIRSPNKFEIESIRSFFSIDSKQASDKTYQKVYVSRRSARSRKVINESEVEDYLLSKGFICIELEKISVEQQVKIFKSCQILVSIHGAGLVNSIFMPTNSNVIELSTGVEHFSGDTYVTLCKTIGINHSFVFCRRYNEEKAIDFYKDDMVVNMRFLESKIESLS